MVAIIITLKDIMSLNLITSIILNVIILILVVRNSKKAEKREQFLRDIIEDRERLADNRKRDHQQFKAKLQKLIDGDAAL